MATLKVDKITFLPSKKARFINRELSWLSFNERVMCQAYDLTHPLLERVKFLSISGNNLDEFFMVRVAGLIDLARHNVVSLSENGLTPAEQIDLIREQSNSLMNAQQECWIKLKHELENEKIFVVDKADKLSLQDRSWLKDYFISEIFPVLTPITSDPTHPFPLLPNLALAMILRTQQSKFKKKQITIIDIPTQLKRFVRLPGNKIRYIAIEQILELFQNTLFPNSNIIDSGMIRVTRDSEVEISDESEDLINHFERQVKQRRKGRCIHIQVSQNLPESLLDLIKLELGIGEESVFRAESLLGIVRLGELKEINKPNLKFKPYNARFPERITESEGNCFDAIKQKDIVIHHPYESFDVVLGFIEQAAADPNVIAIKQTLYRTNDESEVVEALIHAAKEGKSVTAVVEIKARFDEEANIRWARNLERAGVHVVYGLPGFKAHAKISMVVRYGENNKLETYVHYGTGNYHPLNAKVYSDLSFFTCDKDLCHDATLVFNYLTGYAIPDQFEKISMAPLTIRSSLIELIDNEITNANNGKSSGIWIKVNALVDPELIDKLYEASQQGVPVELIVRGICVLKPGVPGLSDNIRVRSIIGRFLEHSRIYCFANRQKLPSHEAKVFIASADWMQRNLNARIEIMIPITNPTVHEQILGQIMWANLADNANSWILQPDNTYIKNINEETRFSAHEYFIDNPSLSGRGKALKSKKSRYIPVPGL